MPIVPARVRAWNGLPVDGRSEFLSRRSGLGHRATASLPVAVQGGAEVLVVRTQVPRKYST